MSLMDPAKRRERAATTRLPRGLDAAADLAESDPAAARAGCRVAEHHLVAVREEGAAVTERLGATPGQLEERAALVALGAADGAGGVEVAGAERGAVDGEVGQHLGRGPVHGAVRRAADHRAVQLNLHV